jgi:hypothetical protein
MAGDSVGCTVDMILGKKVGDSEDKELCFNGKKEGMSVGEKDVSNSVVDDSVGCNVGNSLNNVSEDGVDATAILSLAEKIKRSADDDELQKYSNCYKSCKS